MNEVYVGHVYWYEAPVESIENMPSGWYVVDRIDGIDRVWITRTDGAYAGWTYDDNLHKCQPAPPHIEFEEALIEERLKNNPHYDQGIDPWEVMQRTFTPEEYRGYLKGNILKYAMRFERKGTPVKDLHKLIDHAKELIRIYAEESDSTPTE